MSDSKSLLKFLPLLIYIGGGALLLSFLVKYAIVFIGVVVIGCIMLLLYELSK